MRKTTMIALPLLAGALLFTGCSSSGNTAENIADSVPSETAAKSGDDKLKIVTTIFPEYDWVKNILGEKAEDAQITLLCNSGTDMHSYQPTVEDIVKISECDVFIYTGGESDSWTEDVLKSADNNKMKKVELLEAIGANAKKEETVEGMQEEDHDHSKEEHEGDYTEYDEHVWLSLKNAVVLTDSITEAICEADSDNAELYRINAEKYKESLNELDGKYSTVTQDAAVKTLVFADRFPFRYMTDDYGLDYYAAFNGCSAETEASFETIAFLSQKIDELSLKHVMTIEGGNNNIAGTVISNTKTKDQDILELNSLQSVTIPEIDAGLSYLDIMEDNLIILERALN